MKTTLAIFVAIFALCHALPTNTGEDFKGHKVLDVHAETPRHVKILLALQKTNKFNLDFWKDANDIGTIPIHVDAENLAPFMKLLWKFNIQYEVSPVDLHELVENERASNIAARARSPKIVGTYATIADIETYLQNTAALSPIAEHETIGYSYEGAPISLIKFSTGNGRQIIFLDSNIHAREWIAGASAIWVIEELATKYGVDPEITTLLDDFDVYILPMLNPDGYEYSYLSDRFWRKTRSRNGVLCRGADANRNFDYPFFGGPSTSSDPCSDLYKGPSALSESESLALANYLATIDQKTKVYFTVHNFQQFFCLNWAYTDDLVNDYNEQYRVGRRGMEAMEASSGLNWQVGALGDILYPAQGGTFDWTRGILNIEYNYAIELRPGPGSGMNGFVVDASEIPSSGNELLAGMLAVSQAL